MSYKLIKIRSITQGYWTTVDAMIGYSTSQIYKEIPTVQDGPFDPTADAITIRKSISGCCKNKKGAIAVICRRTDPQRVQIVAAYKNKFGRVMRP